MIWNPGGNGVEWISNNSLRLSRFKLYVREFFSWLAKIFLSSLVVQNSRQRIWGRWSEVNWIPKDSFFTPYYIQVLPRDFFLSCALLLMAGTSLLIISTWARFEEMKMRGDGVKLIYTNSFISPYFRILPPRILLIIRSSYDQRRSSYHL